MDGHTLLIIDVVLLIAALVLGTSAPLLFAAAGARRRARADRTGAPVLERRSRIRLLVSREACPEPVEG